MVRFVLLPLSLEWLRSSREKKEAALPSDSRVLHRYAIDSSLEPRAFVLRRALQKCEGVHPLHSATIAESLRSDWPRSCRVINALLAAAAKGVDPPCSSIRLEFDALQLRSSSAPSKRGAGRLLAEEGHGTGSRAGNCAVGTPLESAWSHYAAAARSAAGSGEWALIAMRRRFDQTSAALQPSDEGAAQYFDVSKDGGGKSVLNKQAAQLHEQFVNSIPSEVLTQYVVEWLPGGLSPENQHAYETYLERFSEDSCSRLVAAVRKRAATDLRWRLPASFSLIFSEVVVHNFACRRQASSYLAASDDRTAAITAYLEGDSCRPFVVYGAEGTGKTVRVSAMLLAHESALAKIVALQSTNRPQREVMTKLVQALDSRHDLVWETLQAMDTNRNSTLDREELFQGLDSLGVRLAPAELDAIMAHLDTDGSGSIDYIEFFDAISNFDVSPAESPVESYAVAIRFAGLTSMSSTSASLVRSLTEQINAAYGVVASPAAGDVNGAFPRDEADTNQALWVAMRHASREQPLYIFVDGVDRLLLGDGTIDIDWLPAELPTHVKLVVTIAELSAAKSGAFARMLAALPQGNSLELVRPVGDDAGLVIRNWLATEGRTLRPEHLEAALRASCASNGSLLCLHVIRSIATLWTSATPPGRLKLQSNLSSALSAFFEMVDSRHPAGLLETALLYLVGAHTGVTELELDDLLALHDELLASACPWVGAGDGQPTRRLPSHFVPRLLADLRPVLMKLPAVGHVPPVWTWAHQQFKLAASFHVGMATKSAEVAECFAGYLGGNLVVLHSTTVSERLRVRNRRALDEQPLWRGSVPNVRVAAELLPACESAGLWLSIHAQLTSVNFVEAKFASGLAHELPADYRRLALVDLGRADAVALAQFQSFVDRNMDALRRAPHRTLQAAMIEPIGSCVRRDAEELASAAALGDIRLIRFATALASASDLLRSPAWLRIGARSGAAGAGGDADPDEVSVGTLAALSGAVDFVRWKIRPPMRRKPSWLLGEPFVPADPRVAATPTACALMLGRSDWADTVHVLVATCDGTMTQHSCALSHFVRRRDVGLRSSGLEDEASDAGAEEGGSETGGMPPLQVIDGLGAPVHLLAPTPPTSPWAGVVSAALCSAMLWEMRSGLLYEACSPTCCAPSPPDTRHPPTDPIPISLSHAH